MMFIEGDYRPGEEQFAEGRRSEQPGELSFFPLEANFPQVEHTGIPIDIEGRLAEMDRMWSRPEDIGATGNEAANIMDDRLNLLHQEVLATGDQASIHTMNVVNFTFKFYYFNWLPHEKRVTLYHALKTWYEKDNCPQRYFMTSHEKKIVSECSERFGNGTWPMYEGREEIDDFILSPTLEDLWDYDFPDPGVDADQ